MNIILIVSYFVWIMPPNMTFEINVNLLLNYNGAIMKIMNL